MSGVQPSRFGHLLPMLNALQEAASQNCVYVMSRPGAVKIGRSTSPKRRRANIQTGHPGLVKLEHSWDFGLSAAIAERLLHQYFANYRLDGEWFSVPVQLAALVADLLHKQMGRTVRAVAPDFDAEALHQEVMGIALRLGLGKESLGEIRTLRAACSASGARWIGREKVCYSLEQRGYVTRKHGAGGCVAMATKAGRAALMSYGDRRVT